MFYNVLISLQDSHGDYTTVIPTLMSKKVPSTPLRESKGTEVNPRVPEWSPRSARRVPQNEKKNVPKRLQGAPSEGTKNEDKNGIPYFLDFDAPLQRNRRFQNPPALG